MRFLFKLFLFSLLLFLGWNLFHSDLKQLNDGEWKEKLMTVVNHPHVSSAFETLHESAGSVFADLNALILREQKEPSSPARMKKFNFLEPEEQLFSIHHIELGDPKEKVDELAGSAQRAVLNEYGVDWYIYHDNYHNFFIVAYDEQDKVAGLYTNQNLISSKHGIRFGSSSEEVRHVLGEPLPGIRKGFVTYRSQNNGEYDLFYIDDSFITVFYDKHENHSVTAIQIISSALEQKREQYYPEVSTGVKEGFEQLLFELTNATRARYGLPLLTWDEEVQRTARAHSSDMAVNDYFDHINLDGQTPFERLEEDHISFRLAGENLAAGQPSSIFAHEGLMNSLGHRENILHPGFRSLGIGVAFDQEGKPFFTEKFLTR